MPKAFTSPKGFRRSLAALRAALIGGMVADSEDVTSGASPVSLDISVYESRVRSSGAGTTQVVRIPVAGAKVGQRKLVTFQTEGAAGDVVRINATGGGQLATEGHEVSGVTGYAQAAHTNADLGAAGDFALYEFKGGATPTWHLLYQRGATLS
jgi:hypothetical protein